MSRAVEYALRSTAGSILGCADEGDMRESLDEHSDEWEGVMRLVSPWMDLLPGHEDVSRRLPLTECSNCKGKDLGFEATTIQGEVSGAVAIGFYQGCNDCSETLWLGSWDEFHAVLNYIFEIKVPRCE